MFSLPRRLSRRSKAKRARGRIALPDVGLPSHGAARLVNGFLVTEIDPGL